MKNLTFLVGMMLGLIAWSTPVFSQGTTPDTTSTICVANPDSLEIQAAIEGELEPGELFLEMGPTTDSTVGGLFVGLLTRPAVLIGGDVDTSTVYFTPICTPFDARSIRVSGDVNHDGTATVYLTMEEDDQNNQVILDQYGRDGWFTRDWQYSRTTESELVGATYTFQVQPASNGTFRFRGRVVDDYGNEYVSENIIELTFSNVSDQFRVANNGGRQPKLIHASEDASLGGWPVINTMGQRIGTTTATGNLPAGILPGIYFVNTNGQRVQMVKR